MRERRDARFFELETGAQIAFDEYGDPNGAPVFFCHGWPSSRTMAELTDEAARELGSAHHFAGPARAFAIRQFHPNRTLLDWPPLLGELAAHLGIDKFRILAISGGAPYAYVAGWTMPERVEAIAVVSGAPPIAELQDRSGLLALYSWLLALRGSQPGLLRISVSHCAALRLGEDADSRPPAPAQDPAALRRECFARLEVLRGLLRKRAPGVARIRRRA